MDRHLKLLGILHVVYGFFVIMLGMVGFLLFMLLGRSCGSFQVFPFVHVGHFSDHGILHWLAPIWILLVMFAVLLTIAGIIGGLGLYFRQNWARGLLLVVGVLMLFRFPLGTALGIYTLWVLAKPEAAKLTST